MKHDVHDTGSAATRPRAEDKPASPKSDADKKEMIKKVGKKEKQFTKLLRHPAIREVRTTGLLIAVEFPDEAFNKRIIDYCIKNGVLTDWFLFAPHCMRIAPPLNISTKEIEKACSVILKGLDELYYA